MMIIDIEQIYCQSLAVFVGPQNNQKPYAARAVERRVWHEGVVVVVNKLEAVTFASLRSSTNFSRKQHVIAMVIV